MNGRFDTIQIKDEGSGVGVIHSPLYITVGLWYYTRPDDYGNGHGDDNFESEAVQDVIKDLLRAGLLKIAPEEVPQHYEATEGLAVWIEAILRVPLPVQRWVVLA